MTRPEAWRRCWWCDIPLAMPGAPVPYHRRGCVLLPQRPRQLQLFQEPADA